MHLLYATHTPWKHLPPEKAAAAAAVGFSWTQGNQNELIGRRQTARDERERFLTQRGILRATDGVLYIHLFSYLSSANSKNCKLTSLNNPAPRYGAGKENKVQRERVVTVPHACESSVSCSCTVYGRWAIWKTGDHASRWAWSCNFFFSSLYSNLKKMPRMAAKHGSGLAEVTIMSLFNLLDTKLADRQALGLLGVNGRLSYENNVWTIGLAPVISWKSKPPFTIRVSSMNYVFFPFGHFLYTKEYRFSSAIRKIQSCSLFLNNDSHN